MKKTWTTLGPGVSDKGWLDWGEKRESVPACARFDSSSPQRLLNDLHFLERKRGNRRLHFGRGGRKKQRQGQWLDPQCQCADENRPRPGFGLPRGDMGWGTCGRDTIMSKWILTPRSPNGPSQTPSETPVRPQSHSLILVTPPKGQATPQLSACRLLVTER